MPRSGGAKPVSIRLFHNTNYNNHPIISGNSANYHTSLELIPYRSSNDQSHHADQQTANKPQQTQPNQLVLSPPVLLKFLSAGIMNEYNYDAAASTIKIEDITSDGSNRNILRRLKENDPNFGELWVFGDCRYRTGNTYSPEGAQDLGCLGDYIGRNAILQALYLSANPFRGMTNVGIQSFCRGVNSNRSIQKISFDEMNLSGGEIFQSLRPFFENNDNLSELRMFHCVFGAECAGQLSSALRVCNKSLKFVRLDDNEMGDASMSELIEALSVHPQLEKVDLSFNHNIITARGCQSLAVLLENPNSHLETLNICSNNVGDEGALIFANALASNRKLKRLYLHRNGITAEGWSNISKVLCDTSSINNTFLSNHTLVSLGDASGIPEDVRFLLESNRRFEDKKQVAIKKILKHHQYFNMRPFFEWDLKVLPIAINWFEKARFVDSNDVAGVDRHKLGAIYQFIRAMPEVFEPVPAAAGEKRKRSGS